MMKAEQFHTLVKRLEETARRDPSGYRTRVALLAVLGHAYVWGVLLLVLGALALVAWLTVAAGRSSGLANNLAIPLVVFAAAILRAMWVRFDRPEGRRLSPGDAPEVFGLVRALTERLVTPRFHEILVTFDFNAAVSQTPRLGFLGWYRNSLLLGLPLMEAMSPEEFRAVLAHEMGHLSRQHGRFGAWIYRTRAMWGRLIERLEAQRHWGYRVFDWFLSRWAPYFNAYSFVLARRHEYEADRFAAEVTGAEHLGRALRRLEVVGAYLDQRVWPDVLATVERSSEPPEGVPGRLAEALRRAPAETDARDWLVAALARRTDLADTHPSLRDRLGALGVGAGDKRLDDVAAPPERTAAEAYLGPLVPDLRARLDREWRRAMAPRWTERHKAVAASRRRLAELAERARGGVLPEAEGWERASLVLDLDGAAAAEPLLREVVERSPNHAGAHWVLGEILLARNDARGVSLIERAVDIDPSARGAGYDAIRRFYERRGEEELAARYERQAWEERDLFTLAEQERRGVSPSDEFAPHALPAEAVAAIREALARIDQVAEAYLGQKVMRYYSEDRLYVLGVRFRISWYKFRSQEWTRRLLQRIGETVPVPGQWFVIALEGDGKKIGDKLRALAGACVYGAGSLTTAAPRVNDAPPDLRPATPTPSQDDVPPELATPASAGVGVLDAFRVLWSPGALFERLRDRPRILMPMITIMILTLIIGLLSRPYVAASIVARAPDAVDPGGTATGQAILVALGMPIIALQLAFFLWLTVNLTGTATRYPALLSVQTHVMIVFILQWTAGLVLLMIRGVDGITAQTDLRPAFGLDLLMPPARGYLEAVLREVGVFAIWSVVLLGIGISKTHDASRKTGYVAAGAAFVATLAQLALDAWLARR